jgi:predicted HAD superfamily Cof-like phosphohydrolase
MSFSPAADLAQFHDAIGDAKFVELDTDARDALLGLRFDLIAEEFCEVAEALGFPAYVLWENLGERQSLPELAKELADLVYVIFGTAHVLDIPLEDVFERVHASNMSKFPDGKPLLREDGKILKGPGYHKPVLDDLFDTPVAQTN